MAGFSYPVMHYGVLQSLGGRINPEEWFATGSREGGAISNWNHLPHEVVALATCRRGCVWHADGSGQPCCASVPTSERGRGRLKASSRCELPRLFSREGDGGSSLTETRAVMLNMTRGLGARFSFRSYTSPAKEFLRGGCGVIPSPPAPLRPADPDGIPSGWGKVGEAGQPRVQDW